MIDLALFSSAWRNTVLTSMAVAVSVPLDSISDLSTVLPGERKIAQHSSWSSPFKYGRIICSALAADVIGVCFIVVVIYPDTEGRGVERYILAINLEGPRLKL